jgi:nucleoid DNA-binding protein
MKKTNDLIEYLANGRKVKFAKMDVKEILDGIVEFFEECAENQESLKVRGFGFLSYIPISARDISGYTDKQGVYHEPKKLPPAIKVNFRLAENIRRYGSINSRKNIQLEEDFGDDETLDEIE